MHYTFTPNLRLNVSLIHAGCDDVVHELTIPQDAIAEISIPSYTQTWVHNGNPTTMSKISPELTWPMFAILSHPTHAQIELKMIHQGTITHDRRDITLLPLCTWNTQEDYAQATAAFVLEDSRTVKKFVQAANCTPDPAGNASEIDIARRLYAAFQHTFGLYYLYDKGIIGPHEQLVRFPAQILHDGGGTCIDLALFYAAALRQAGCWPVIVILENEQSNERHAMVGVWQVQMGGRPIVLERDMIKDAIYAQQLFVIDPNWLTLPENDFDAARNIARENIEKMRILYGIDIQAARYYTPLISSFPQMTLTGQEDEPVIDDLPKRLVDESTTRRAWEAAQTLSRYALKVVASRDDLYTELVMPLATAIKGNSIYGRFPIGRGATNHLNFARDMTISRDHALIIVSGETMYLQDLGSMNGTRMKGIPLRPFFQEPLSVGDVFSLGYNDSEQMILLKRTVIETQGS